MTENKVIELKPCPFCGCKVECYLDSYGALAGGWNLRGDHAKDCIMRQVHIINVSKKGRSSLIEGWNKRVKEWQN